MQERRLSTKHINKNQRIWIQNDFDSIQIFQMSSLVFLVVCWLVRPEARHTEIWPCSRWTWTGVGCWVSQFCKIFRPQNTHKRQRYSCRYQFDGKTLALELQQTFQVSALRARLDLSGKVSANGVLTESLQRDVEMQLGESRLPPCYCLLPSTIAGGI